LVSPGIEIVLSVERVISAGDALRRVAGLGMQNSPVFAQGTI
jgi:hypothetical protein